MSKFLVRKAAVLGAGVMGAQIAAHLANAGVQPVLFELAADGRDKSANVKKALEGLARLEPSPLATKGVVERITPDEIRSGAWQRSRPAPVEGDEPPVLAVAPVPPSAVVARRRRSSRCSPCSCWSRWAVARWHS